VAVGTRGPSKPTIRFERVLIGALIVAIASRYR
jgi:hypothetical protein